MDMMEIDDDIYINKNMAMEGLIPSDFQRRKQPSRCATASLGLLCAVLLAGNIGQIIYHEIISRPASADPTQTSYEALTADRKQLEAALSNVTKDKDQLQLHLKSLTTERDAFKVSVGSLRDERDRLQASYDTSKRERRRLQTSYADVQRELAELQRDYDGLTARNERLQNNSSSLQRSYDALNVSENLLQISYRSMWRDKQHLQTRYDVLQGEEQQLQANYSSAAAERDELQKKIDNMRRGVFCPPGWEKLDISCYRVSTKKANWTLSRQDCIDKGADLVVINSENEQMFLNGLLESGQNAWIGLTDSVVEGTWTWVDGTAVTTTFWQPGQPNSYNGNQDCGEMVPDSSGVGKWNDDGCFAEQVWICEK